MGLFAMKERLSVSYRSIYLWIFCVFMIRPYYIQISPINRIWSGLTLLCSIVSFVELFKVKKLKYTFPCVLLGIFYIIATALNESKNIAGAISTFDQFVLAYNTGLIVFSFKHEEKSLNVISRVITLYLYIDVICGFLEIGQLLLGLPMSVTFLAYDNYALYYILPMLSVKWAISSWKNNRLCKKDWLCWFLCLIYKIKTMSLNAIAVLFVFAFFYWLFSHLKKMQKIINPKSTAIVVILLLVGVCRFEIHNLFAKMFYALGRGTTLGYRTVIWGKTIPVLFENPLWGYGKLTQGSFQSLVGFSPVFDLEANHPHNLLLQIWFDLGLLGIAVYVNLVWKSIRPIKFCKNAVKKVCICSFAAFWLAGFLDGYPYIPTFYLMLSLIRCMCALPNGVKDYE